MAKGFVYILVNPALDNLVKIGKTTRTSEDRAKELSSSTSIPAKFIVIYETYFQDCDKAETFIHTHLEEKGVRVTKYREFFEMPIKEAINSLLYTKEYFEKNSVSEIENDLDFVETESDDEFFDDLDLEKDEPVKEPWEEMFEIGEAYYYGHGETLQDYDEALIYYQKALKLGSKEAYLRIGNIYKFGNGVKANTKTALKYYKEGAKKGFIECYANMAMIFDDKEHIENSLKSWNRYFELELLSNLREYPLSRYIKFIRTNNLEVQFKEKLSSKKELIVESIKYFMKTRINTEYEHLNEKVYQKDIDFINANL